MLKIIHLPLVMEHTASFFILFPATHPRYCALPRPFRVAADLPACPCPPVVPPLVASSASVAGRRIPLHRRPPHLPPPPLRELHPPRMGAFTADSAATTTIGAQGDVGEELGARAEGRGARRILNGTGDVFLPFGRSGMAGGIANGDVCISCWIQFL